MKFSSKLREQYNPIIKAFNAFGRIRNVKDACSNGLIPNPFLNILNFTPYLIFYY